MIHLPIAISLLVAGVSQLSAADADYIPQPGKFPPPNSGHYIAGELVSVDQKYKGTEQ